MKVGEKAIRWVSVLGCASIGYSLAIFVYSLRGNMSIPLWVMETLAPMVGLTSLVPVDPDLGVALGIWGPFNAVVYGLVGLVIAQKQIERLARANA
jgi:hypothetical protein